LLPLNQLKKIEIFIKPLNPPVYTIESNIRDTPFKILISVLISSRTKDQVTLSAVRRLFKVADSPRKLIKINEKKIQGLIYPVGFFRQKAKNIILVCERLIQTGGVPDNFEDLIRLPGVGRKTANLVLALAFNKPSIAVDTHVFRISKRLGWAKGETPEEVEVELRELFPVNSWNKLNKTLVGFGQTLCKPIKPLCDRCILNKNCPYFN